MMGARMQDVLRDVRYAVGGLRRAPAFALVSGVMLALGIGAATAVFSVINGVLIKPLAYPDAEELISIGNTSVTSEGPEYVPLSATQYFTYRDETRVFASIGLWARSTAVVTGSSEPDEVQTLQVTDGTLQALAVPAAIGRWFSRADDEPGSAESIVLAHAYWQRRYGGDRSVIGRTLIVDARPRTVIGVMPAGFRFLNEAPDLILPFRFDRRTLLLGAFNYSALARLQPGIPLERAAADVGRMNAIWLNMWPAPQGFERERFAKAPVLRSLKQEVVGDIGNS